MKIYMWKCASRHKWPRLLSPAQVLEERKLRVFLMRQLLIVQPLRPSWGNWGVGAVGGFTQAFEELTGSRFSWEHRQCSLQVGTLRHHKANKTPLNLRGKEQPGATGKQRESETIYGLDFILCSKMNITCDTLFSLGGFSFMVSWKGQLTAAKDGEWMLRSRHFLQYFM